MKRLILTLVFINAMAISICQAQINPTLSARFQTVLDSTCKTLHIRGASVSILIPNVGTWNGVYGESYKGKPVTPGMIFNIGSNTKTYTAASILLLEEKGLLKIDDTIGTWIQNQLNISGKITIRQLLNHTSGIYNFLANDSINGLILGNPKRIWNPEELFKLVKKPDFKPGTSWEYSNTNYEIAGVIIEKVTGKRYYQAIRDLLFTPQNFNHAVFFPHESTTDTIAHNWAMELGNGTLAVDLMADTTYSNNAFFSMAGPAGEIMTTAEENAEFWYRLTSGKIISPASLKEMLTFIRIGTGVTGMPIGYGLGIFRYVKGMNGRTILEHGGTNIGFIGENTVDTTSHIAFSVLTNQDSVSNDDILMSVIAPLHKQTLHYALSGINDVSYNSPSVNIYPNPAMDMLNINLKNIIGNTSLSIYDMTGKQVLNSTISKEENKVQLADLKSGLYIIKLMSDKGEHIYSQKLMIEK